MRVLIFITVLTFVSCEQSDKLPNKYKAGLFEFSAKESEVTGKMKNGSLEFGDLWIGFNRINTRWNHDTLIADVNVELSISLNYDGGFNVKGDTLFLYAKCMDKVQNKERVFSTLTYKIASKGLKYEGIEFVELN